MTISIFARGAWKTDAPFTVSQEKIFTCIAIRSFREIEAEGEGVYELVYQPAGLPRSACETDRIAAVSIITLEQENGLNILVPTSYILTYPFTVTEGFSRIVIGVEIGILSDKVPLDALKEKIQQGIQDVIGVDDATVELFKSPYSGVITPEQAELIEANRLALIQSGGNVYSENKRLEVALALANEKVARLERIIIDNAIAT